MITHPLELTLLDASCLLNVYATERLRDIAIALPRRLGVADYVINREALYVRTQDEAGDYAERTPVDLAPLVNEGLIQVVSLGHPEELAAYVDFAARVDDGEAVTSALALHNGYAVATDDRKARRVLAELAPWVQLVSTLDLLREWTIAASISDATLRQSMMAMQSGASYTPSARDPSYEWWLAVMRSGDDR